MSCERNRVAWGQIIISCVLTSVLWLIGNVIFYHYTSKSPDLVYEVFPATSFSKESTQISICDAWVENAGNKEIGL
jgi:hypothetical protein